MSDNRRKVSTELSEAAIQWELEPYIPPTFDRLAFSEDDLVEHVYSLQENIAVYRELAQVSIQALHTVTCERDRLRRTVRELRELLRGVHRHNPAGRAA